MLNNYTSGGQVFLHKLRMLRQVISTTVFVSIISGILLAWNFNSVGTKKVDWDGAITYGKAQLALKLNPALSAISIRKTKAHVDAYSKGKLYRKNALASSIISSARFKSAWLEVNNVLQLLVIKAFTFGIGVSILLFLLWHKFGRDLKNDRRKEGSGSILTANDVRRKLRNLGKCSDFYIGRMPLVKDTETRHILVTGSTGSGKTNLIHNLLPQVKKKNQSAIIIDQTGEMIAKYYDPQAGDIIFNPLDERSKSWDFWSDCFGDHRAINGINDRLEKFAKILFGFNRKSTTSYSDPFWENSAEAVFIACAEYAFSKGGKGVELLQNMLQRWSLEDLEKVLKNTPASRYLSATNKITASSILSVMTTSTRPLAYLSECNKDRVFSLNTHLKQIRDGSNAWLFLSTKPSQRELTLPLIACLTELAISLFMENGIQKEQKLWFVIDEVAALGKLPALSSIMSEGRKYGACVIAAMQSLNQLYSNYGGYAGSTIFGQFGTKFFFRNDEPQIAKMITDLCGTELINKQQKNTSFGASEFRDSVSYTEQEKSKPLVEYSDIASLDVGECYVLLPEPKIRLAKIEVPESRQKSKTQGFIDNLSHNFKEPPQNDERELDEPATPENQGGSAKSQNSESSMEMENEELELQKF